MEFKYYLSYIVSLILVSLCNRADTATPSFVKPCRQSDAACLKGMARVVTSIFTGGLPQYNIEPLDPLHIEHIASNQAGLNVEFSRTDITGLRNCQILDLRFVGASKLKMEVKCNLILKGDYKLGGQLLLFPVHGNGKYKIKISSIRVTLTQHMKTVQGDDGHKHWHVAKLDHEYKVMDKAQYNFDNLFDGNRLLAQTTLMFANNNWEEIFNEIAPPIVEVIINRVSDATANLYKAVPVEDLILP